MNTTNHRTKTDDTYVIKSNFFVKSIWHNWLIFPESSIYNIGHIEVLSTDLNIHKLERALQTVVNENINLNSTFIEHNKQLFQKTNNNFIVKLLKKSADSEQKKEKIVTKFINKSFDLINGPLFRFILIKHKFDDKYSFFIVYHHIIIDGICFKNIHDNIRQLYNNNCVNLKIENNLKNYNDYQNWLLNNLNYIDNDITKYYSNIDKEYFSYEIGVKKSNKTTYSFSDFRKTSSSLPNNIYNKLITFSTDKNYSTFNLLKTAWSILMSRYASQDKMTISYALSLRPRKFQMLKGYMANIIFDQYKEEGTFLEQLKISKERFIYAIKTQRFIPFYNLHEYLRKQIGNEVQNIFPQVGFSKIDFPVLNLESNNSVNNNAMAQAGEHRIMMQYYITPKGINFNICYNADYFEKYIIDDIADNFNIILEQLIDTPDIQTNKICVLSQKQYDKIVNKFNATERYYPLEKSIHELFKEQTEKTPNNNAIHFNDTFLTYKEINSRTNRLAKLISYTYGNKLKENKKSHNSIGIYMERSPEMIIAILAILKSGATCVPFDITEPKERTKSRIINAECRIILCSSLCKTKLEYLDIPNYQIIVPDEELNKKSEENDQDLNTDDIKKLNNIAFTLYTSGSTGEPKGVMLTHSGIINLIWDHKTRMSIDSYSRILQFSSVCSDVFMSTIFCALLSGGCAYLIDEEMQKDINLLQKYIIKNNIDFINIPVSIFSLMETNQKLTSTLKTIIIGGEICDKTSIEKWSEKVNLFNAYGPTEASITASINKYKTGEKNTNIGRAINNKKLYILDSNMNPVPVGVLGELFIGGEGISEGYLNNSKMTIEKFIQNPFTVHKNQMQQKNNLYKTGDICRWYSDGDIEFIGRRDNQIKIRGHRVELDEIETNLLSYEGILQAIVIYLNKQLVAYYSSEIIINKEPLHYYLSKSLPNYMIPSNYEQVDKFHLTNSGKINRKILPTSIPIYDSGSFYEPPTNENERKICCICMELLNVKKVGLNDNFFHIGGDSIKAYEFVILINNKLHIDIPVSKIYLYPVLGDLTKHLEKEQESQDMVYYNKNNLNSLYMIPPKCSGSEVYINLAQKLKVHFNCIGFETKNIIYNHKIENISELCSYYITESNYTDINKSIYIMGFSFGGKIALEIASILEEKGYKNIKIIILDTILPRDIHKHIHKIKLLLYNNNDEQIIPYNFSKKLQYSEILLFKSTKILNKENTKLFHQDDNYFIILIRIIYRFWQYIFINKFNNINKISSKIRKINIECVHTDVIHKETDIIAALKKWI